MKIRGGAGEEAYKWATSFKWLEMDGHFVAKQNALTAHDLGSCFILEQYRQNLSSEDNKLGVFRLSEFCTTNIRLPEYKNNGNPTNVIPNNQASTFPPLF